MSIQNLSKKNDYEIFCKKLTVDEYDVETIVVDNIIVDNATVLSQVTTPHITSGTSVFNTIDTITLNALNSQIQTLTGTTATYDVGNFQTVNAATTNTTQINSQTINALTINSDNVNGSNGNINTFVSQNASIDNLTINNSMIIPSVETPNINVDIISTYSSGNVAFGNNIIGSDISLSSSITTPATRTNTIDTTTGAGNISVIRPTDFSDDITCANLFSLSNGSIPNLSSTNGFVDSISGTNLNYPNGTVSILNGSDVTYDHGFINALETKELTVHSAILSCPDAFFEKVSVSSQIGTPLLYVDEMLSNGSPFITFNTDLFSSGAKVYTPTVNTNTVTTTTGSGDINIARPLVLPNIRPSNSLSYYQYTNGTVNVTGCITTTLGYYFVRVGNAITLYLQTSQSLATSTATYIISGFPSQILSNVVPIRGTCLVQGTLGPTMGAYTFSLAGNFVVFSAVGGGSFTVGNQCGLFGLSGEYTPFSIINN